MARKTYTDAEREAALTVLESNGGNLKKTARETGVSLPTLRDWKAGGKAQSDPQKAAELAASFLDRVREVREAATVRMLELIPQETDLHKVAGALKIANDAARLESGEATQRSEVRRVDEDPERARLARAAAEALEREWEQPTRLN